MKQIEFVIITTVVVGMFGCKAAPQTSSTTPVAQEEKSDTQNVNQQETQETVIVENKKLVIALEEKLRKKYTEMALPAVVISRLVETKVDFVIPERFEGGAPIANDYWNYDYRLQAKSGKVEILIKIMPGESTDKDFHGKKVSVANELMNIMIRLNGANLVADIQNHPQTEASSRFNASSYTTGTFQPVPDFSDKPIASAGIFYKEGYGRVVVIALMDDLSDEDTRTEWITGANSIRFADDTPE